MSQEDIRAAADFCRENDVHTSIRQSLTLWSEQTANEPLREFATEILQSAELGAKLSEIAPWYDGTRRSEQRLAAMLARKFGVNWWRDLNQADERLGAIDDAWHSERIEPLLSAESEANPDPKGIVLKESDVEILQAAYELGAYEGVYLPSPTIIEHASRENAGKDMRRNLDRLKKAGLIATRHGSGISVTDAGVRYLRVRAQV